MCQVLLRDSCAISTVRRCASSNSSTPIFYHIYTVAYEPVWAIGTGLTATPEMAQETHANIRAWVAENVGQDVADAVPIQYGGSMKGANVADLLAQADIDGGLIGGASLTMDFFNVLEVNSWCKE